MKATTLALGMGTVLSVAAPAAAHADLVTFDFESIAAHDGLTTLTLTAGALTATLTRPGSSFAISQLNSSFPPSFGKHGLDPFGVAAEDAKSNTPFILTFSQAVTAISIDMGDFGGDTDRLSLQAFAGANGTGAVLGGSFGSLAPGNGFTFLTPALSSTRFLSAVFIGGNSDPGIDAPNGFPNSVFYDNITVSFTPATTTTPEPASEALFATGLVGIGLIRRRKHT